MLRLGGKAGRSNSNRQLLELLPIHVGKQVPQPILHRRNSLKRLKMSDQREPHLNERKGKRGPLSLIPGGLLVP